MLVSCGVRKCRGAGTHAPARANQRPVSRSLLTDERRLTYSAEFRVAEAEFSFVLLVSAAVRREELVSAG